MKNNITIILIFFMLFSYGQISVYKKPFLKVRIVLKDGKQLNGHLRMESAFKMHFKENRDDKKSKKIDYKTIDSIITHVKGKTRYYIYKKNDRDKFSRFVESYINNRKDSLEVYIFSTDGSSLFYQGVKRLKGSRYAYYEFGGRFRLSDTLAVWQPDYYFGLRNSDTIIDVFSKKRLLKFAEKHLDNCPDLLEKIKKKKLRREDAPKILKEYDSCNNDTLKKKK